MTLATTLLRFVDERLEQMLEAPEMWGADESVELQILQFHHPDDQKSHSLAAHRAAMVARGRRSRWVCGGL